MFYFFYKLFRFQITFIGQILFGRLCQDQVEFFSNIASSHLDKLFDYGPKLQDYKARKLVRDFFANDFVEITKKLAFANAIRSRSGHLPYPYLLPDFITNSIST